MWRGWRGYERQRLANDINEIIKVLELNLFIACLSHYLRYRMINVFVF